MPPAAFALDRARTIHAPVIEGAFLTLECTLEQVQDLSGSGITAMVTGRVQHASVVEQDYARGYGKRYGPDGFMLLTPAPQDLVTGQPGQSGIATLQGGAAGLKNPLTFRFCSCTIDNRKGDDGDQVP